jgi:hypothetical protein
MSFGGCVFCFFVMAAPSPSWLPLLRHGCPFSVIPAPSPSSLRRQGSRRAPTQTACPLPQQLNLCFLPWMPAYAGMTGEWPSSFVLCSNLWVILVWGRAPTRDAPTEFPFISVVFVGVGLVPTREPRPQQSSFPMSVFSLATAPSEGDVLSWGWLASQ